MSLTIECLSCLKSVATDNPQLKCAECGNVYHIGKCAGVTKNSFKTMSAESVQSWQCSTCKVHFSRQSSASQDTLREGTSPASGKHEVGKPCEASADANSGTLLSQFSDISIKLSRVLERVERIERSIEQQSAKSDEVMAKLDENRETVAGIEQSLGFLSAKYDEILTKIEVQKSEIVVLQERSVACEALISRKDAEIRELRKAVDNAELYSRRKNIEIHGIKQQDNENLMNVITGLAAKLQLPEPSNQTVEVVHRLGGRQDQIIVRFYDRNVRDQWVKKQTTLRREGIYINENLTKLMKGLLWATRKAAKEKSYKFVWVRNGRILVRQTEGAAVMHIENENDINKIK